MKSRLLLTLSFLLAPAWAPGLSAQESFPRRELKFSERDELRKYLEAGEPLPEDAKARDAFLERVAQHYLLRGNLVGNSSEREKDRDKGLKDFESEVVNRVNKLKAVPRDRFMRHFGPIAAAHLKVYFSSAGPLEAKDNAPVVLWGAQMLPLAAKLRHDAISDFLVGLLKDDKEHPVVRMYAAKAIKEFFPVFHQSFLEDKERKEKDVERVDALCQFIEGDWHKAKPAEKGKSAPPPMTDDVVRFIRREALASLQEVGFPAVFTKKGIAEGTPVPTLVSALVKGRMSPEPWLLEKYHAAAGICRLGAAQVPDYNPETGIYLVGKFWIELVNGYSTEVTELSRDPKSAIASVPWKVYAESFRESSKGHMKVLLDNTKGHPTASKLAARLNAAVDPIIPFILKYQVIPGELRANLEAAILELQPKSGDTPLFKSAKSRTVKLAP